jgi:hypothetical protein
MAAAGVALLASTALAQTPLGTSFTYQGRLAESGSPANGTYDFRFILYNAPSGGSQVGPTVTRDDVFVSTGLFTVGIDFGAVFGAQRRFLEIGVRPGASTGAYDVVSGRHELTAAPSALFGASAPWTGVTGKPAGFADDVDNDLLASMVCSNGQVPKSSGTAWACGVDLNTTYSAGAGIQISGSAIAIAPLGVTNAMLGTSAVTAVKIASGAVGSAQLTDGSIAAVDIAPNAVGNTALTDGAVGSAELQTGAVTGTKIATSSVISAHVADNSITGSDIAADTIGRSELAGPEMALYQMAAGCANGGSPTFIPFCPTLLCGLGDYLNCAGDCVLSAPTVCNNNVVGYLLAASIP